jgi:hypothetical protein
MVYCEQANPKFKKKIKFVTNNSPQCALSIGYNGKQKRVSKYKIPQSTN